MKERIGLMSKKFNIDVDRIKALHNEIMEFNKLNLEDVQFVQNGVHIIVNPKVIKDWTYTGLNNRDFVIDEIYSLRTLWEPKE
jgi:hypothetical protein